MYLIVGIIAGMLALGACAPPAVGATPSNTDILEVIPHDCWAFVVISNFRELDEKLSGLLAELQLPALSLIESFNQRINLGPEIKPDGSFALVFMPAASMAELGPHAVLIFPCLDVAKLLSEFDPQELSKNRWKAQLVWGPTYVAQKGRYAILGSTEQAIDQVLASTRSLQKRYHGRLLEQYAEGDINIGIAAAEMLSSAALSEWLQPPDNETQTLLNTESALYFRRALLAQIDYAHIQLNVNNARIRVAADVSFESSSTLAKLLAFAGPSALGMLNRLPTAPYILAGAAHVGTEQRRVAADELHKLLDSEAITTATDEQQRAALNKQLTALITALRSVTWGIAASAPNPQGLLIQYGELEVDSATQWLASLQAAAAILSDESLFRGAADNGIFKRIGYTPEADSINGVNIDHLSIELMPTATSETKEVDAAAAFGPGRLEAQIAATSQQTVLICVGGYPRDMAKLLESSSAQDADQELDSARARITPLLNTQNNLVAYLSPARYVDTMRTLARIQQKIERYTTTMSGDPTPAAVTVAVSGDTLRVEVTLLSDLFKGFYESLTSQHSSPIELVPPSESN